MILLKDSDLMELVAADCEELNCYVILHGNVTQVLLKGKKREFISDLYYAISPAIKNSENINEITEVNNINDYWTNG